MLSEILTAVREWLPRTGLSTELLTDREDALRVILETENALAELIVADQGFAPCRFVSLQILDTRLDPAHGPVYAYHDSASSTVDEILRALDQGIAFLQTM